MPQKKKVATDTITADVTIVGGGLAGLSFALLLARANIQVAVIERYPLPTQTTRAFDVRTTAIAAGSARVLNAAGVWPHLVDNGAPIRHIEILDGPHLAGTWPVLLQFDEPDADHPFGWIVDNQDLRIELARAVMASPAITVITPADIETIHNTNQSVTVVLQDGRHVTSSLLVGADGRASTIRDHYRIRTRGWPYDHTAIVATIRHTGAHHDFAIEHFLADGPFAVLPMTDDQDGTPRSAIVWSERPHTARQIMVMDDTTFATALMARLPERYGTVELAGKRGAFPLTLQHAETYIGPRMALIADAAHGIHPIAGQGLNLGMRDVADLADIIITTYKSNADIGADDVLQAYEQRRKLDTMGMVGATDLLTWVFGLRLAGIPLIRRAGLRIVEYLPPVKRFFIHHAMGAALNTTPYAWDNAAQKSTKQQKKKRA